MVNPARGPFATAGNNTAVIFTSAKANVTLVSQSNESSEEKTNRIS
tara:strand:+ start:261 stop:398 length:138 start_codon:yes stop_codon:yes gene_type:complete